MKLHLLQDTSVKDLYKKKSGPEIDRIHIRRCGHTKEIIKVSVFEVLGETNEQNKYKSTTCSHNELFSFTPGFISYFH